MDENLNQDKQLEELIKLRDELTFKMNESDSQKNNDMVEISAVEQEMAELQSKLDELQNKSEELQGKKKSIDQRISQADADKITNTVELEKINEKIIKRQEEIARAEAEAEAKRQAEAEAKRQAEAEAKRQEEIARAEAEAEAKRQAEIAEAKKQEELARAKAEKGGNNVTVSDYNKMLADYNKKLAAFRKDVHKLYSLQKKYENGKIKYEEYQQFALPLSKNHLSLKETFNRLQDLSQKLLVDPIRALTDDQLSKKIDSLQQEASRDFAYNPNNVNSDQPVNIVKLGKINSEIRDLKNEQTRRQIVNKLRPLSNEQLSSQINLLQSALNSGNYQENTIQNAENIKLTLTIFRDVQEERLSSAYTSLTDEQIDNEISNLNDEYMNEWNYSAHLANGMEDNDSSKLDQIKDRIDVLNNIKKDRANGVVTKLDLPEAPWDVLFIRENKNHNQTQSDPNPSNNPQVNDSNSNPDSSDNPHVSDANSNPNPSDNPQVSDANNHQSPSNNTQDPASSDTFTTNTGRPVLTEEDVERLQKDQEEIDKKSSQQNYKESHPTWFKRLGSTVKGLFSKNKTKSLPEGDSYTQLGDSDRQEGDNGIIYTDPDFESSNSQPYFRSLQDFPRNESTESQPTFTPEQSFTTEHSSEDNER